MRTPLRIAGALALALVVPVLLFWPAPPGLGDDGDPSAGVSEADGLKAFGVVYQALTHPRCLNCHPTGDRPLQHDDSRIHAMNVQRGADGHGKPGMRCQGCHAQTNSPLEHGPPGAKAWHLAPREQAFQDRTPHQLAAQLKDPKSTHKTMQELREHIAHDPLVGWGWSPGKGRKPLPMTREALVKAFDTWVAAGAPVPPKPAKTQEK